MVRSLDAYRIRLVEEAVVEAAGGGELKGSVSFATQMGEKDTISQKGQGTGSALGRLEVSGSAVSTAICE